MKKGISIIYKNGHESIFVEADLDCKVFTIMGHCSNIIDIWKKSNKEIYAFDNYNAVYLDEVISIRLIK